MSDIEKLIIWIISILFILLFIGGFYPSINKIIDKRTVYAEVTGKAVKGQEGKYLIYTVDKQGIPQVYEITDSLLKLRFDSSDVYAGIKEGSVYNFEVCGERVRIFSLYPNIYKYEEINMELIEQEREIFESAMSIKQK